MWSTANVCKVIRSVIHVGKSPICISSRHLVPLRVGDPVPSVQLYENSPENPIDIAEVFKGKKGILFSVVGAYTPGCTQAHIPEYINNYDKFKAEGYEEIVCVSVNDPFVMSAWGKDIKAGGKIRMLADPQGKFTQTIDMELDSEKLLGNKRSKRYSLLIEDGVVKHASLELDSSGLACLLCIRNMKSSDKAKTVHQQ